ncbi:MAG: hypothetical protein SWH54_14470 [Thermodesulfobacteriota bacterium]|nr:hypothetical protein [Thermodesulfobacteriota bacterium]
MKIAFIHYHLKTGGVTTVLSQQIKAIQNSCDTFVLTGSDQKPSFPVDSVFIPGLGYDSLATKKPPPHQVAESIINAISEKFGSPCDALHVHNPILAKNADFLKILSELQKRKIKLFLQVHDFAEDGRPNLYFLDQYLPDCHYGVINSRDYDILLKAGLKKEGLHKIFNMIEPFCLTNRAKYIDNIVLYPIRAIRRKNIGEAILVSLYFKSREKLSITLPPNSPADFGSYKGWKNFVAHNNINVEFESGLKNEFSQLVLSSRFMITTSISEGFGFSFVEPWSAQKLIWGRKLPEICRDFEKNGINLDHLYSKLVVPLEWIEKNKFYQKWSGCILEICKRLHYDIDKPSIEKIFSQMVAKETIDFALLDEPFQKAIISQVMSSRKEKNVLIRLNPYLASVGMVTDKQRLIQHNMKAVLSNYSKQIYKQKLLQIYKKVMCVSVSQRIDKKILLSCFIDPRHFSLLKWCEYSE